MITGCHPGECHYMEQNYKALRRFLLLRRVLQGMGIEPERVKLVWASAAEGAKFAAETTSFIEEIRQLGPLNWGKSNGHSPGSDVPPEFEPAPEFPVEVPA